MPHKKEFIKLPESELEVMQILWDMSREGIEEISANAMFRYAPALSRLKLTTVLTLLQRLITKEFISSRKVGRSYCYTPLVDETEYKRCAAKDFLETVYHNNAAGLISALIGGDCLSAGDLEKLRAYVNGTDVPDTGSRD